LASTSLGKLRLLVLLMAGLFGDQCKKGSVW